LNKYYSCSARYLLFGAALRTTMRSHCNSYIIL